MSATALRAVCDAFLPEHDLGGGRRTPSATELGVPEELARSIALNPSAAERRLTSADLRAIAASAGGGRRIGERTLVGWADSRSPQRRAAFLALRRGVLATAYAMGGTNGDRNPLWEHIGYPGPPGRAGVQRDRARELLGDAELRRARRPPPAAEVVLGEEGVADGPQRGGAHRLGPRDTRDTHGR